MSDSLVQSILNIPADKLTPDQRTVMLAIALHTDDATGTAELTEDELMAAIRVVERAQRLGLPLGNG